MRILPFYLVKVLNNRRRLFVKRLIVISVSFYYNIIKIYCIYFEAGIKKAGGRDEIP